MKIVFKTLRNFLFLTLLFIICISSITLGYTGILLHTYNVYTQKEPVAQVVISEKRNDDKGSFAIVRVKVYNFERTGLTHLLFNNISEKTKISDELNFKIYGDTVYMGGPIIKFKDEFIFFNFKTLFKIGKIFGRYELDNVAEQDRIKKGINSSFDINNGLSEWRVVFDNYQSKGLLGDIIRIFVDTTQLSMAGQMIGSREIKYTVYITNNGFIWKIE